MNDAQRLLELRREAPPGWRPLLTRAAQTLASVEKGPGGCGHCGGEIDQLPRGRPRRYCTTCSPRKKPEKAKVSP